MKLITILTALTLVCTAPASAAIIEKDITVSSLVQESFHAYFKYVTNVTWSQAGNLYRAAFVQDGKTIYAYYSTDGVLVTVAHGISVSELPARLQKDVKNLSDDYRIVELYRMETENGIEFCATLSNGKEVKVLQTAFGKWQIVKV